MLRNISCFRLRAHKLRVETATWNSGTSPLCDHCDCAQVQDEVHALLMCRMWVCVLSGASMPTCSINLLVIFQWSDHTLHNQFVLKLFLISSCSTTTVFSFLCLSLWICCWLIVDCYMGSRRQRSPMWTNSKRRRKEVMRKQGKRESQESVRQALKTASTLASSPSEPLYLQAKLN